MQNLASRPITVVVSILLTSVIVLLMILIGPKPVEAVTVSVVPSTSSVVQGDSITFDVTIAIQSNEHIPIDNVKLRIFSDAGLTTELTASPYNSPRTMSFLSATPASGYGYGYGYGYDPLMGQGYDFGYVYGYGYGYAGSITLTYRVTVDTTGWATGSYYARGDVDSGTHVFSSTGSSFTVNHNWDINTDGCINVLDVILVGQHWGETGTAYWIPEDVNGDGVINVLDVILIGQHWGEGCP